MNKRVKRGTEWVFLAEAEPSRNPPNCKYGVELSLDERATLVNLVNDYREVFAHDPKAPQQFCSLHQDRTWPDKL